MGGSTQSLIQIIDAIEDKVYPIVLLPKIGPAVECFKRMGIEVLIYPYVRLHCFDQKGLIEILFHPWRINFIRHLRTDLKCTRYITRILHGKRVDIVHSNYSPITIGCLLSKRLNAKHIWHIREFLDLDFNYKPYFGIPLLRRLINNADARIAVTSQVRDHWRLKRSNTWTLLNPIRKTEDICCNYHKEPYFLFCSYNLTEKKGARRAIQAFGLSKLFNEGMRLKLIGNCEPSYYESLVETAREYNCIDSIDFIPRQDDVKPFFSKATAFIMASEHEGMGRVTAEALFFGCPVIAKASGGSLDLIRDGVTGYLFETLEECASKMRQAYSSDTSFLISNGLSFAKENLTQEVYGPKILDIYHSVISS